MLRGVGETKAQKQNAGGREMTRNEVWGGGRGLERIFSLLTSSLCFVIPTIQLIFK